MKLCVNGDMPLQSFVLSLPIQTKLVPVILFEWAYYQYFAPVEKVTSVDEISFVYSLYYAEVYNELARSSLRHIVKAKQQLTYQIWPCSVQYWPSHDLNSSPLEQETRTLTTR